jgi:hypothetical protein
MEHFQLELWDELIVVTNLVHIFDKSLFVSLAGSLMISIDYCGPKHFLILLNFKWKKLRKCENLFLLPTEVTPITVSWHPMVLIAVIMDFSQVNATSVHDPI